MLKIILLLNSALPMSLINTRMPWRQLELMLSDELCIAVYPPAVCFNRGGY